MEYSQITAAENALESYYASLSDSPALTSLAEVLESNSAALSSFTAAEASINSVISNHGTLASNYIDSFPTQAQAFISSAVSVQNSILTANGFPAATATGSASANGAMPTGHAMLGASAAAMAGFIGAVALL
jgi:hypothetical protein